MIAVPQLQALQTLVPMVIETSGRTERAFDIFSLLLKENIVFLGTAIDDQSANLVVAQLLYLQQQDPEKTINLYINCPGGSIYAGLAIYDTMQALSNPITTWAIGMTASFGTVLLAAGTPGQRYTLPHSTIHMHPAAGGAQGYTPDVEIRFNEMKRLQDTAHRILAKHTGQPLKTIADDFERDRWMDAATARDYGFVDEITSMSILAELAGRER